MPDKIILSTNTVELLLKVLTQSPSGKAGIALGQDLLTLNKPIPVRTENDILEEHAAEKAEERTNG